jgi:AraC family transcriptional regulator
VNQYRSEYERRVNRAIDYIRAHLADELSLELVAGAAAFSPYHFHRVFRAATGETLFAFIQRLRLERAALALMHHPNDSVLSIALDSGFSSPASFARAFRRHFGMTATAWRGGGARHWSKRGKANSKPRKARPTTSRHGLPRAAKEAIMKVSVRDFPPYRIAYMRYVGPYGPGGIPALWTRFNKWIETHGLGGQDTICLGIARDDPGVTPPDKCRYDACLVVDDTFVGDSAVNVTDVPGGRYAVAPFHGTPYSIRAAWEGLYRSWLPSSGYQPDDRPCLEV